MIGLKIVLYLIIRSKPTVINWFNKAYRNMLINFEKNKGNRVYIFYVKKFKLTNAF